MVTTVLLVALAAFATLVVLLIGAVYSALVIAHKTDEMIQSMNEDPARVAARREQAVQRRSALGNA